MEIEIIVAICCSSDNDDRYSITQDNGIATLYTQDKMYNICEPMFVGMASMAILLFGMLLSSD